MPTAHQSLLTSHCSRITSSTFLLHTYCSPLPAAGVHLLRRPLPAQALQAPVADQAASSPRDDRRRGRGVPLHVPLAWLHQGLPHLDGPLPAQADQAPMADQAARAWVPEARLQGGRVGSGRRRVRAGLEHLILERRRQHAPPGAARSGPRVHTRDTSHTPHTHDALSHGLSLRTVLAIALKKERQCGPNVHVSYGRA